MSDTAIQADLAALGVSQLPAYLGSVAATRTPNNVTTGFLSVNCQLPRVAASTISKPRIAFANWYQSSAVHEAGSGGTATYSAAIQYPISATPATGTWQQVLWSGGATVAVADGVTTALSDQLTLSTPIPAGAAFLIRVHVEASAQTAFFNFTGQNTAVPNQLCEGNATPNNYTDKTLGGTILAGTSANIVCPVLIVDTTSRASFYIGPADSRSSGTGDTIDATWHTGELARSIGDAGYSYLNTGCPSETLTGWLTGNTRRLALATYFSHVIGQDGINDVAASRTVAQIVADITTATALFSAMGKPVFWCTLPPISSSTDVFVTTANQTASANNALRAGVNDMLRACQIAGVSRIIDINSVMEQAPVNSGIWAVSYNGTGGVARVASDGIHENWACLQLLKQSGIVTTALGLRAT